MPKLNINGQDVDVPDSVAAALAERDRLLSEAKAQLSKQAEEAGRAKAEADAKAKAEADAKHAAEMERAARNGEVATLKDLAEKKARTYAENILSRDLAAAIASHPGVRKDGLDDKGRARLAEDLAAVIKPGLSFDLDTGRVMADGQPVDLAARIAAAVQDRPHFAAVVLPAGTGADRQGAPPPAATRGALKANGAHLDFIGKHGHAAWLALPEK